MIKIANNIILILAFAFAGSPAFASTSTIPVDANGNVGFGTTVPAARLQVGSGATPNAMNITGSDAYVVGNIEVDGKIYGDGGGLTSVPGFLAGLTANYVPRASGDSSVVNSVIYADGTNVGINSATPTHRLAVDGNVYINGNLGIGSSVPAQQLDLGTGSLRMRTPLTTNVKGIIYKGSDPFISNCGSDNFFFGSNAGNCTTITDGPQGGHTMVGANAGKNMGAAYVDTFIGWNVGSTSIEGSDSLVVGNQITGGASVGGGAVCGAGISPVFAMSNGLVFGAEAFKNWTSGTLGTAIGARSSYGTTSGALGVSVGYETIGTSTGAVTNYVLLGYRAGYGLVTDGNRNILVGSQAGNNISTGTANVMIGYDIEAQSATQTQNLSIGNLIFGTGLNGSNTTASTGNIGIATHGPTAKLQVNSGDMLIGTGAFSVPSDNEDVHVTGNLEVDGGFSLAGNLGLGSWAPTQNIDMTGSMKLSNTTSNATGIIFKSTIPLIHDYKVANTDGFNTILSTSTNLFGSMTRDAGVGDTSASYNTGFGKDVFNRLTYGKYNTGIGYLVLPYNTYNNYNTGFGVGALSSVSTATTNCNTGFGALVMFYGSRTGNNNTAFGYGALLNISQASSGITGSSNVAMGINTAGYNTSGAGNIAIGETSLYANTTGSLNVAIGGQAGSRASAGEVGFNNVMLGYYAGFYTGTNSSNSNNILVGYRTAIAPASNFNRNIMIGAVMNPIVATADDQVSIGHLIFGAGGLGSGVVIGTGNVGIGTYLPVATFEVKGSTAFSVVTKSVDYTATGSDHTILVNADSGVVTITLPAVSGSKGRVYQIKKIDVTANTMTILPNGSDQIDGEGSLATPTPYRAYTLISDGSTNWRVL